MIDFAKHPLFWNKVRIGRPDECWEWQAATYRGYGYTKIGGKALRAHRVSWEIVNGKIQGGLFVLHKCDNSICVNPDHLFLGTQRENIHDMVDKGRHVVKYAKRVMKYKAEDVIEIRRLRESGSTLNKLAKQFSVTRQSIYNIVKRRSWKDI